MNGRFFITSLGLVAALATALVYGVGGVLSIDGALTVGTLTALSGLLVRLYGSRANVLLVDSRRKVLDSFLRSKEVIASKAEEVFPPRPFPNDAGAFQAQLSSIGHLSAFAALKTMAPLMGSLLIRELFFRCGLDEHAAAAEITDAQAQNLFDRARQLLHELNDSPFPRIYKEGEHPVRFAIVELQQLRGLEAERFESVHQAIRVFLSSSHRDRSFHAERDRVIAKMKSEKDRIERTTAKISSEEQESSTRAMRSELSGKLLMAHLHMVKKGDATLRVENVFSPAHEEVEIVLDLNLSPAKNAERYFARARKARQSLDDQSTHKEEYRDRSVGIGTMEGIFRCPRTGGRRSGTGSKGKRTGAFSRFHRRWRIRGVGG